ncbi:sodium:solute symporter [Fusobacterium sp. FSA-380-WT-3A]|uniref:sodium:solute symporter n=1 Tax=Fusobacterium sp. FSA-380-WT-3A TaxID=2725304 RepID=UPI0014774E8F|nr:sodium:solute symporter [Fusobacterium sp. FSA-380-WT-3A]NME36415.1 sodium:solute symporter [Fusobacterium sp. FSA-380-WT-3A]
MSWHWFNWVVIALYFIGMFMVGVYFARRTTSTDDYFKAGGRVPAWVTACSIYATALSSISFIAIPASVFRGGWLLGMAPIGIILMVLWAALVFVPFFRRVNVTTAYEYLGKRFDNKFRIIGSLAFILFHIIRMAVVLYLPTLALQQALPSLNPVVLTVGVAVFCVAYTSMGGIEAVLWSDAIQTIVLLVGAFLIIIMGFSAAPEGVGQGFKALSDGGLILNADFFSFDLAKTSLWAMLIGGLVNSIYSYVGSQDIVQRYNTTKNEAEAKKSLFINIPLLLTSIFIFVGMGSALYVFFNFGNKLPETINGNAILPYFVIKYIPTGISGLVLAAIFAAAQSTVSSSLNSVSTCMTSDILEQLRPDMSDKQKLNFAKGSSWVVGIISTILAVHFLYAGQGDMFLYFQAITGLLGGPIAGVFLVGIFFDKVNTKAVWVGFIASVLVATYLGNPMGLLTKLIPEYTTPKIFEFLISLLIIGSNVVVSLIASLFTGKPTLENIKGLTYSTVKNMEER